MYRTLYVQVQLRHQKIFMRTCVFLLTLLIWFISASDGVDVWHLRLDQEQLDSHV